MSFNVTGGDFPVEKSVRDRRSQQGLRIFYHVLAAQRLSNTSFFLAWRLVDILHERYRFSVFFSKLCLALRGTEGLVRKGQEMKADIRSGASLLKPKKMQQNLKSWCISESSGLILLLVHVAPCSAVTVMIHESNAKLCFFWAWSPRSRHPTVLLIFAPNASHFEPNLFQWQAPVRFSRISWSRQGPQIRTCAVLHFGKPSTALDQNQTVGVMWGLMPWPGFHVNEVGQ